MAKQKKEKLWQITWGELFDFSITCLSILFEALDNIFTQFVKLLKTCLWLMLPVAAFYLIYKIGSLLFWWIFKLPM